MNIHVSIYIYQFPSMLDFGEQLGFRRQRILPPCSPRGSRCGLWHKALDYTAMDRGFASCQVWDACHHASFMFLRLGDPI